ncbi:amino acid-binding protein [Rhodococcus sp. X156]|uniref:amino acid-binding protein n=1 Tax=Rhodococcus sp. X156 TaxID=2499145 RepID=UPI000FDCABB7|nr:amino acid-binding protein [Rhodococcus sp. X156]
MSFLMRVQVPDQPGALGLLASALGRADVDILSVDVVERDASYAVDDLVVEIPRGSFPDGLITAAEGIEGVQVISVRPFVGVLDTHRELELIDVVAGTIGDRLQTLVDGLPRVLSVGWAMIVGMGKDGPYRVVGSPAAPESHSAAAPWLPLRAPAALDENADWVPESWRQVNTTVAAAPLGEENRAVLIGRPGGPEFRPSEVARLGHMAGIVATVLG